MIDNIPAVFHLLRPGLASVEAVKDVGYHQGRGVGGSHRIIEIDNWRRRDVLEVVIGVFGEVFDELVHAVKVLKSLVRKVDETVLREDLVHLLDAVLVAEIRESHHVLADGHGMR